MLMGEAEAIRTGGHSYNEVLPLMQLAALLRTRAARVSASPR